MTTSSRPWERDDAPPYWRYASGDDRDIRHVHDLRATETEYDPDDWQGGYFIPADLIDNLRGAAEETELAEAETVDDILDAATRDDTYQAHERS